MSAETENSYRSDDKGESLMTTVRYGSDTREIAPNKTLKEAAKIMGAGGRLRSKPNAFVNGNQVTDWNKTLKKGDQVEFVKASGRKG
ncbi:MAG: hypothetical protein Q7S53_00520 [bacterium]|nr:hypothetical protein [bacterium]